jgi:hypothetical protein
MRSDVTVISCSDVDSEVIVIAVLEYPSAASASPACAGGQETPIKSAPAIAWRAADIFKGCSHARINSSSSYEERLRLDARSKHFFANCMKCKRI